MALEMKLCITCKEWKPLVIDFPFRTKKQKNECKKCVNEKYMEGKRKRSGDSNLGGWKKTMKYFSNQMKGRNYD